MGEWKSKTLGEITSYMAKGTPPKYAKEETGSTIKVLNQKCNRNFRISYDEARLHDNALKRISDVKMLMPGDVLINSTGIGTAGRVAQILKIPSPTTIDGHMILIRPTDEIDFLYYGYAIKSYQKVIMSYAEGLTGQTEISKDRLKNEIIIRFPSDKQEQHKIGNLLYGIDKKIEVNEQINQNLEQQAQAVFNFYYDSASIQRPFTERIQILGGGTPKTGNSDFWNGDIPFFSPKDVGSPYTFQTEKYVTQLGLSHCNSKLYPTNTCFVTARGTVGKVSLAGRPMAMNQSCYALMSDTIEPILVYFYALKVVASLKHKASGAVFDAIITRDFETEYISFLSNRDSEAVLKLVRPMMDAIYSNSEENLRLTALRDILLPRLMSGELDVSSLDI